MKKRKTYQPDRNQLSAALLNRTCSEDTLYAMLAQQEQSDCCNATRKHLSDSLAPWQRLDSTPPKKKPTPRLNFPPPPPPILYRPLRPPNTLLGPPPFLLPPTPLADPHTPLLDPGPSQPRLLDGTKPARTTHRAGRQQRGHVHSGCCCCSCCCGAEAPRYRILVV